MCKLLGQFWYSRQAAQTFVSLPIITVISARKYIIVLNESALRFRRLIKWKRKRLILPLCTRMKTTKQSPFCEFDPKRAAEWTVDQLVSSHTTHHLISIVRTTNHVYLPASFHIYPVEQNCQWTNLTCAQAQLFAPQAILHSLEGRIGLIHLFGHVQWSKCRSGNLYYTQGQ